MSMLYYRIGPCGGASSSTALAFPALSAWTDVVALTGPSLTPTSQIGQITVTGRNANSTDAPGSIQNVALSWYDTVQGNKFLTPSVTFGGTETDPSDYTAELCILPGDYLAEVSGVYGTCLNSFLGGDGLFQLTFATAMGAKLTVGSGSVLQTQSFTPTPYGTPSPQDTFSLRAPRGFQIIGLFCHTVVLVDSLGIVVTALPPQNL